MNCLKINCPTEMPEHCPSCPEEVLYYTEVIVDGELKIPDIKPPKEKIIDVSKKICLKKVVPIPVKLDNGCMAGYKLLVTGTVKLGIEYSALVPEQEVHFVHFDVPFQGIITGKCQEPLQLTECELKDLKLNVCIEHLQVHQIDPRTIKKVIVLLLWLKDERCHVMPSPCEEAISKHFLRPSGQKLRKHSHNEVPSFHNQPHENDDCHHKSQHSYHHKCQVHHHHDDTCIPDISKELSINQTLIIPCQKPPMECILNSDVKITITKAEVINTPLTGFCNEPIRKVVVTGNAEVTVKYVADVPNQQVHVAIFVLPFRVLIEWPGGPPQKSPIDVCYTVEHFQVDMLDKRRLFEVLVLRIDVIEKE